VKRLSCTVCGRQEVWGLISSHAWGHTNDGEGRICPNCVSQQGDRRERAGHEPHAS
jgi:hypothetical protein